MLTCVLEFVSYRQLEKQLTLLFYMLQPGFAGSRSSSSALPKQATAAIQLKNEIWAMTHQGL